MTTTPRLIPDPEMILFKGHAFQINSVTFSPDGSLIASWSNADLKIKIWNVKTRKCVGTLLGHAPSINPLAFSPDGSLFITGGRRRRIEILSVETGECVKILEGHDDWINSIAFSPDGSLIASGGDDKTIRIWNVETGECLRIFERMQEKVLCLAFSPTAQYLACTTFQEPEGWVKKTETSRQHNCFSLFDFRYLNLGHVHPLEARFAAI